MADFREDLTLQHIEVPLLEQDCHRDLWPVLDLSEGGRYVEQDQNRFRKTVASAFSYCHSDVNKILNWRVRTHDRRECLELTEISHHCAIEGGNLRLYFSDPIIDVFCFQSGISGDVMFLVILSSGLRSAILDPFKDQQKASSILKLFNGGLVRQALSQNVSDLNIREGLSITCADAAMVKQDSIFVSLLLGTSGGVSYRAKMSFDNSCQVQKDTPTYSWIRNPFRSPGKVSGANDRLCSIVHGQNPEDWFTLSEGGKLIKWRSGRNTDERLLKIEKSVSGVKHAFLANNLALQRSVNEDDAMLVFSLKSEHSSTSLMAWCSCNDLNVIEMDQAALTQLVSERFKELGDRQGVQQVRCLKTVQLDGYDGLLSIWQGYESSVLCLSQFNANAWLHKLVHTMSLEMSTELEVATLHIEAAQNHIRKYQYSIDAIRGRAHVETENYLESLIFRSRWFRKSLVLCAVDELLDQKGLSKPIWPDQTSLRKVKEHVREAVDKVSRCNYSDSMHADDVSLNSAVVWCDLFRLCYRRWCLSVDDCLGVGCADIGGMGSIIILKESAITVLRQQERIEREFFAFAHCESLNDHLLWVAYQVLVWAQESDPGGIRFSAKMNSETSDTALQFLLHGAMMNQLSLHEDCDPEVYMRDSEQVDRLRTFVNSFFDECRSFCKRLFARPEHDINGPSAWFVAARDYALAQKLYVVHEILRGVGLFLSLLTDFSVSNSTEPLPLHDELEECLSLLGSYHALHWCSTKPGITVYADAVAGRLVEGIWTADRSLLSLSIHSVQNLDEYLSGMHIGNEALSTDRNGSDSWCEFLVTSIFKELYTGNAGNAADVTEAWKDLNFLSQMPCLNLQNTKLNPAVLALIRAICCMQLSNWSLAEQQLDLFVDAARFNSKGLNLCYEGEMFGVAPEGKTRPLREVLEELLSRCGQDRSVQDAITASHMFFLLHDEDSGLFKRVSSFSARLQDSSCSTLRLLEMNSLRRIRALATRLESSRAEIQIVLDAISMLASVFQDRIILGMVSFFFTSSTQSDLEHFDKAYALIADKIKECRDMDIDKLRKREEDADLIQDDILKIYGWLDHIRTGNPLEVCGEMQSYLAKRRLQTAYRALRGFIAQLQSRRLLHRVTCYPWIGCGQTVDSLLKELCDVPGQAYIDAAYNARYAFNMSRSDYGKAGETMGTYCFNLAARVLEDAHNGRVLVPLSTLRKQADTCLAAINAYSLVDENFAFFKVGLGRLEGQFKAKRHGEWSAVSGGQESKHFKSEGSTMGWHVTLGSSESSMGDGHTLSSVKSVHSEHPDAQAHSPSPDPVITLATLRRHYAIVRCRIKLAERCEADGRGESGHRMLGMMEHVGAAWETAEELVQAGLADEALTLAQTWNLDPYRLAALLTRQCLDSTAPPTPLVQTHTAHGWAHLQAQLEHLDRRARLGHTTVGLGLGGAGSTLRSGLSVGEEEGGVRVWSVAGVAAGLIMEHSQQCLPHTDPPLPLPPWLYKALKDGPGGREESDPSRIWAGREGADAAGLARLFISYGRIKDAGQLVLESIDPLFDHSSESHPPPSLHLYSSRYTAYGVIDQVVEALSSSPADAHALALARSIKTALERRMGECKKEAEMLGSWSKDALRYLDNKVPADASGAMGLSLLVKHTYREVYSLPDASSAPLVPPGQIELGAANGYQGEAWWAGLRALAHHPYGWSKLLERVVHELATTPLGRELARQVAAGAPQGDGNLRHSCDQLLRRLAGCPSAAA